MKQIFTIAFCLISLVTQAQQFDDLIKQADNLYDQEQFAASAEMFDKAFALEEGSATQYYNAACSWALTGDTVQSMMYLNLSADKGWINLKHIKRDKDLLSLHATEGWNKVLTKVEANQEEYEKAFDQPLKTQLEKIYVRDQTLRQLYGDAEAKFGKESEEMNYFWTLVSRQDSLNELEVFNLIDTHGWVGKSLVGGKANMALWLVIQHAPIETQEKYLPLLRESVKKGESSGRHLALLEDRILMRRDKPQRYGSQIVTDEATGQQVVYEIEDPEFVNERRKAVGLGPIEQYVKSWGIEWTIEQKVR